MGSSNKSDDRELYHKLKQWVCGNFLYWRTNPIPAKTTKKERQCFHIVFSVFAMPSYASSDQAKEQAASVSIRPEEFIKHEFEILKESFR